MKKHIENNLEHFSTFEFVMEIVNPVVPVHTLMHNTNSGNINLPLFILSSFISLIKHILYCSNIDLGNSCSRDTLLSTDFPHDGRNFSFTIY